MNFIEISFPDSVSVGAIGGPSFATTVSASANKTELRSSNWMVARYSYKINCNILSDSQISDLISLFNICRGKAIGFRYKDWSDYKASDVVIGTGDGKTTIFQLVKRYNFSGYSYVRTICKPSIGIKIYLNGTLTSNGFTIDQTTGLITFIIAPATGVAITADFCFDIPVRFNNDSLDVTYQGRNKYDLQNIELIEINPFQ